MEKCWPRRFKVPPPPPRQSFTEFFTYVMQCMFNMWHTFCFMRLFSKHYQKKVFERRKPTILYLNTFTNGRTVFWRFIPSSGLFSNLAKKAWWRGPARPRNVVVIIGHNKSFWTKDPRSARICIIPTYQGNTSGLKHTKHWQSMVELFIRKELPYIFKQSGSLANHLFWMGCLNTTDVNT